MESPRAAGLLRHLPQSERTLRWAVIVGLLAYGALLVLKIGACASASDSSGYLNHAKLLAAGTVHVNIREVAGLPPSTVDDYFYAPLGLKKTAGADTLVPTYPTGMPLFLMALAPLAGWQQNANWVIGLHAIGGIILVYALGRAIGLTPPLAVLGAAVVGVSPLYLYLSLHLMSDVPAMVWTLAAILAALRSREHAGWAFAAGFAVSLDVLIRPANALVFAPVAVAVGLSPKRWLALAAGGLPGGIFFFLHSYHAYGSPLATGYGDTSGLFGRHLIAGTLAHYGSWLPVLLTPVIVFFPGLVWCARQNARIAAVLTTWVVVYLGFYAAYYHTHETWWYLRFVLPAAPVLICGSLLVIQRLTVRLRRHAWAPVAFAALMALLIGYSYYWNDKLNALEIGVGERVYPEAAAWTRSHLPPDAVIAAMQTSGALFYYTPFTLVRWDMLGETGFARLSAALQHKGQPLYAVLFPFETEEALKIRMPGEWTQVGSTRHITIWKRQTNNAPAGL